MRRVSGSRFAISNSGHTACRITPVLLASAFLILLDGALALGGDRQAEARRLFEEAQKAKAQGDLALAEKKYLEVIRLAPDLTNAYQNLGITYFAESKYAEAASVLEKAVKLSPQLAPAHFMLGLSYYKLYQPLKAIANFQIVRRLDPRDANALLYLGKSQIQVRDYLGAAESLENLRKLKADDPDVLYSLSVAYLKLMLANVTRLSKAAPDSSQLWLVLAQEAEARGDNQSAANDLEHALRVNPKGVGIHYALGSALAKEAKYQEAMEEFKKELQISPNDPLALWKIGEIALRTDPQEALGYLERSVELSPDLPQAVLAYGRALARLGETDRAVQQFQRVERLAPEEDSVHYHLSRAYRLLGREEDAKVEMAKFEELAKKKSERTREQARQLIELTREGQKAGETPEPGFDPSRDPSHP